MRETPSRRFARRLADDIARDSQLGASASSATPPTSRRLFDPFHYLDAHAGARRGVGQSAAALCAGGLARGGGAASAVFARTLSARTRGAWRAIRCSISCARAASSIPIRCSTSRFYRARHLGESDAQSAGALSGGRRPRRVCDPSPLFQRKARFSKLSVSGRRDRRCADALSDDARLLRLRAWRRLRRSRSIAIRSRSSAANGSTNRRTCALSDARLP